MQLTNICRDVAEDWRRGRLYLPDELLSASGAPGLRRAWAGGSPGSRPAPSHARPRRCWSGPTRTTARATPVSAICRRARVRSTYGATGVPAIGDEVRAQGCDPLAGRAVVSDATKLPRRRGELPSTVPPSGRRSWGADRSARSVARARRPGAAPMIGWRPRRSRCRSPAARPAPDAHARHRLRRRHRRPGGGHRARRARGRGDLVEQASARGRAGGSPRRSRAASASRWSAASTASSASTTTSAAAPPGRSGARRAGARSATTRSSARTARSSVRRAAAAGAAGNVLAALALRTPTLRARDLARHHARGPRWRCCPSIPSATYARCDGTSARDYLDSLALPGPRAPDAVRRVRALLLQSEDELSAAELLMMFHFYFMGNREGLIFDVARAADVGGDLAAVRARLGQLGARRAASTGTATSVRAGAAYGWRRRARARRAARRRRGRAGADRDGLQRLGRRLARSRPPRAPGATRSPRCR